MDVGSGPGLGWPDGGVGLLTEETFSGCGLGWPGGGRNGAGPGLDADTARGHGPESPEVGPDRRVSRETGWPAGLDSRCSCADGEDSLRAARSVIESQPAELSVRSALPRRTDLTQTLRYVSKVPTADMPFMSSYLSSIQREAELH